MFHKMYYYFKPGKIYWIVYIIARKGGIAAAGLLFRANPGFQMAVILLVMFVSYVWQVKHQPYMSSSQRVEVVRDHKRKVAAGNMKHRIINDWVKMSQLSSGGKPGSLKNVRSKKNFSFSGNHTRDVSSSNTVE